MAVDKGIESQFSASGSITDVAGVRVGQHTDLFGGTGCTVVLCEAGAVAGVDVRGASPGTRETDLLRPGSAVPEVHAVLLSGGSAFGLGASDGVVQYLKERKVGHPARGVNVPIVPAAILFDLNVSGMSIPAADDAYAACNAASKERPMEGTVGAGTGASVAKVAGFDASIKGGLGTAAITLREGITIGAIVATNAIGGVYDMTSGSILAGPRGSSGEEMQDPVETILAPHWSAPPRSSATNTTIGVVATDALLTKTQSTRMASAAHDGLAMAVRPAHTVHDGDTFFALATGVHRSEGTRIDIDRVNAAVAVCVSTAVARSVREATGLSGLPAIEDIEHAI